MTFVLVVLNSKIAGKKSVGYGNKFVKSQRKN